MSNTLESNINLGRVILILHKQRYVFGGEVIYSKYLILINNEINRGSWIFSHGKFGDIVGASCVEKINYNKLSAPEKEMHTAELSKIQLKLRFFWVETGSGKQFMQQLRDELKARYTGVIYARIKNNKTILKMLTQDDATTFMRSSKNPHEDASTPFLQTEAARDFYLPMHKAQTTFAQCVGEMALLMVYSPLSAISSPKPVVERMQICARLEQYRFYTSPNGVKTGLLTWGWLTQERLSAVCVDINSMQAFEWSEGSHLAIIDIVTNTETDALLRADLAGLLYPDEDIWLLCQSEERVFFKKWAKHHRKELLSLSLHQAGISIGAWHELSEEKP